MTCPARRARHVKWPGNRLSVGCPMAPRTPEHGPHDTLSTVGREDRMACAAGTISPARLTSSGLGPGAQGAVIFSTVPAKRSFKRWSFQTVLSNLRSFKRPFFQTFVLSIFSRSVFTLAIADQSQLSAPPVWYSITRVSKKFRSFFRSIISAIHGKGFSSCG